METLTDVQIRNWLKAGSPVAKSDGDGLTFILSRKGTAAWTLRYRLGAKQAGQNRADALGLYSPPILLDKIYQLCILQLPVC